MNDAYRQLVVELVGDVCCLCLRQARLPVGGVDELLADVDQFMASNTYKKVVFSLGPDEPTCMYSMFLAKLVSMQRRLQAAGGAFKIAEASENVKEIFAACRLREMFDFQPDRAAAIAALA